MPRRKQESPANYCSGGEARRRPIPPLSSRTISRRGAAVWQLRGGSELLNKCKAAFRSTLIRHRPAHRAGPAPGICRQLLAPHHDHAMRAVRRCCVAAYAAPPDSVARQPRHRADRAFPHLPPAARAEPWPCDSRLQTLLRGGSRAAECLVA